MKSKADRKCPEGEVIAEGWRVRFKRKRQGWRWCKCARCLGAEDYPANFRRGDVLVVHPWLKNAVAIEARRVQIVAAPVEEEEGE